MNRSTFIPVNNTTGVRNPNCLSSAMNVKTIYQHLPSFGKKIDVHNILEISEGSFSTTLSISNNIQTEIELPESLAS